MKEIICKNGEIALVDDEVYDDVINYKWVVTNGYAWARIDGRCVKMHYFVLKLSPIKGYEIHHKNENKLDNQRGNIKYLSSASHKRIHLIKTSIKKRCAFRNWCKENHYKLNVGNQAKIYELYKKQNNIQVVM